MVQLLANVTNLRFFKLATLYQPSTDHSSCTTFTTFTMYCHNVRRVLRQELMHATTKSHHLSVIQMNKFRMIEIFIEGDFRDM